MTPDVPAGENTWPRPVPLVGDPSSASQRAADPAGWAMAPETRDALHQVIGARRDVRRFRPDAVDDDVLHRLLSAAHAAPSVGHSQPWRFVVVRDPAIRDRAAVLTDRERLRQAALLEPDAARRLLDLQLEGVREAPLGVVVCCDRRTPSAGVLGRATFPDADLWSCAAAIQNLWLAARAEGLGLGWVTLFRPEELAGLLALPDGVVTLGWLCLGWPDERPPAPGLERAGWSRRLPLADVVLHDRWPDGSEAPTAPPSHLPAPGRHAVVAARDEADRLLTPPGSLGVLDRAVDRVVALGGGGVTGGSLVLVAADHPVAAHGVSAYDARVSRDLVRAAVAGTSMGATAARLAGLEPLVVDAGVVGQPVPGATVVRPADPRGDLVDRPAMTPADARRLLDAGRAVGRERAPAGLVALGEIGVGNTTVAAALACGLLGADPEEMTGLGAGADADVLARKRSVVAAAVTRARRDAALERDPLAALAHLGGPEFAVLAGVVLGTAEAGGAVVLDGFATSVAALVAVLLEPGAQACLVAGQRSRERGHALVLQHLGCEPLLDLRIRAGEGVGAALAAGVLLTGLGLRREAARVDS
jgi:nicotinate-nucleotide--dimethylbenzimidazole phosphoribosyltransferase